MMMPPGTKLGKKLAKNPAVQKKVKQGANFVYEHPETLTIAGAVATATGVGAGVGAACNTAGNAIIAAKSSGRAP